MLANEGLKNDSVKDGENWLEFHFVGG